MGTINLKAVDEEATAKALANAGILYYCYGLTQNEIAKRMQVSRSTVSNYLRIAREQGIVDIRINGTAFTLSSLSKKIRELYSLSDAYLAETDDSTPKSEKAKQVSIMAAMALRDIIKPGDRLGVAWGELISMTSTELPGTAIDEFSVFDLLGGGNGGTTSGSEAAVARFAARFGGSFHALRSPMFSMSNNIQSVLLNEPAIASHLSQLRDMEYNLFSVEPVNKSDGASWKWFMKDDDVDYYLSNGAVAFCCGNFINLNGTVVKGPLDEKRIAVNFKDIQTAANGVLVTSGTERAEAALAVLNTGAVKFLVTDQETALFLSENNDLETS